MRLGRRWALTSRSDSRQRISLSISTASLHAELSDSIWNGELDATPSSKAVTIKLRRYPARRSLAPAPPIPPAERPDEPEGQHRERKRRRPLQYGKDQPIPDPDRD